MSDKSSNNATDSTGTEETTHFGYQTVGTEEKAGKVAGVFHSVASSYDLMNDLMSAGLHRLWKRFTVEQAAVRRGQAVLDLAGGTGDLAGKFASQLGSSGHIVLADINASMLQQGRRRLIDAGVAGNFSIAQVDAENLPFADASFDCITIAFGLRNVTEKEAALASMLRVLKPGGKLSVRFSSPSWARKRSGISMVTGCKLRSTVGVSSWAVPVVVMM